MTAEPIRCKKCGAPLPLLASRSFNCPHCKAHVAVPDRCKELYEKNVAEASTRREAEERYAYVARVPSRRFDIAAIALVLLAPAVVAAMWMQRAAHPPGALDLFTLAIVPALFPGTALWMWSAAIHATVVRFQLALAARRPKDKSSAPCCRNCGAPLHVADAAIFSRCAYCGTDSLVTTLADAVGALDEALRREIKTIGEATTALLYRRRIVVGGTAIVLAVLAAFVATIHLCV